MSNVVYSLCLKANKDYVEKSCGNYTVASIKFYSILIEVTEKYVCIDLRFSISLRGISGAG
jgi:hypothetical protein